MRKMKPNINKPPLYDNKKWQLDRLIGIKSGVASWGFFAQYFSKVLFSKPSGPVVLGVVFLNKIIYFNQDLISKPIISFI